MFYLEMRIPSIVRSSFGDTNVLECNNKQGNADVGEDAEIIIDMKCPIKLKESEIVNGIGDFGTNKFSIFGSYNSTGPWSKIYSGKLKESITEVCYFVLNFLQLVKSF